MASITTDYIGTWKSLVENGSTLYTIFWRDFNPRDSDLPQVWPETQASWEASYNLSWFQCGNEVCFCMVNLSVEWLQGSTLTYSMSFQKYKNWWQNAWWNDSWTEYAPYPDYWSSYWYYVWVDYDEIRTDATRYRFLLQVSWWWVSWQEAPEFTISNLSFDNSLHSSWYMWVEWTNLCYTDASYSSTQWYAHRINMDTAYTATNVWSDNAWYIWLPNSSNDNHIYYIDANWYTRRTKESQTRWDEDSGSVSSDNKWYMRVSNWWDWWYAHLCYINNIWFKRRIINWWI